MTLFSPTFAGTVRIRTPHTEFLARLQRRIETGFLTGMPPRRSRYSIRQHSDRELTFDADDVMTALNVGLNHVEVRISEDSRLEYVVTYWRWAAYCVALCASISLLCVAVFFLFPDCGPTFDDRTGSHLLGNGGFLGIRLAVAADRTAQAVRQAVPESSLRGSR